MNRPLPVHEFTLPWANGFAVTIVPDNAGGRSVSVAEERKQNESLASSFVRLDRWNNSLSSLPTKKASRAASPPRHPRRNTDVPVSRKASPPRHPRRQSSWTIGTAAIDAAAAVIDEFDLADDEGVTAAPSKRSAAAVKLVASSPQNIPSRTRDLLAKQVLSATMA